ncbi:MAG: sodium/proline symporter [Epsilonproteobacteria bacterium]|nr:sodium/proline symporter [Campylobacterota bacterium]
MDVQILAAFGIYFSILTVIGLIFYFKAKHADAYMLGDRSVNYFVTAIATQASDMGAWLFMAFPAALYTRGMLEAWTAIGLVFFMYINWHFIAPRLRRATEQYGAVTLSSFLAARCGDRSGIVRLLTACMALLFFTFYIASALVGLGKLFASAFGLNYHIGTFLGLASAIVYTLLGGFVAIAWCDLFQGIFLLGMIVLVPAVAYTSIGGWDVLVAGLKAHGTQLSLVPSVAGALNGILLALGWGLGYFGQPHILTNFMGIDDANNIKYAKWVGIAWQILVLSAAIAIGLIAIVYFPEPMTAPENLFVVMAKQLFPPFIAGFVLCGILAATLSTLDSHIFISGSVVAEDVYKRVFCVDAPSRHVVWMSRLGSILVSCVALWIARDPSESIYNLVQYAWSGLGSAFGPLVILSLSTCTITPFGAAAGILSGGMVSAFWPLVSTAVSPLVPGFFVGLLAIYFCSLATRTTQKSQ